MQSAKGLSFFVALLPIAVLIPSFIRSGEAIYKITGVQPTTISITAVLALFFLRIRQNKPLLSSVYQNMILGMSICFAALAVIALIILSLTFPNFIYASYHIRVEVLGYLVALSLCLWLMQKDNKFFIRNSSRLLLLSPIVFLSVCILLLLLPNNLLFHMTKEDSIVEISQFATLLFAGISGIYLGYKRFSRRVIQGIMLFLIGLALFGVAGEEISWGQRIFDFQYSNLQNINVQNETTVHNIKGVHGTIPMIYALIGFVGSVGALLLRKVRYVSKQTKKYLLPDVSFFFFFFIPFVYNALAINYGPLTESTELLLYTGMLFFLIQTIVPKKRSR